MSSIRTKFIDYDARRNPRTDRFCCRCQRDLTPGQPSRAVYVDPDMCAVHPADIERKGRSATDLGWVELGLDCAKILGLEWSVDDAFDVPADLHSSPSRAGRR